MRGLVGALLGLGLLGWQGVPETPRGPERLNVVFFLVDDLGWADTGVYGSTFYETPNVGRLAASGMRFTQAYAAAPVCRP